MRKILFCGMVIFIWDSSAPGYAPTLIVRYLGGAPLFFWMVVLTDGEAV